jgi:glycosyltransferase involved in cell wall biosynthesis/SAM-dependent methyltransferase
VRPDLGTETGSLVSVLMPAYNPGPYLAPAIESVLRQTHGALELLVVDDGSTDGSAAVLEGLAARDARVRCLAHPGRENRGMSASRSLALRHARGEHVALLDADDVWLPTKLEHQLAELRAHPTAAFLEAPVLEWHSWTGRPEDAARDRLVSTGLPGGVVFEPPELLRTLLRRPDSAPWPSSMLVRRDAFLACTPEDEFRDVYEDQVWYAKLCLAYGGVHFGSCQTRHRKHATSATATADRDGREARGRVRYLEWLERFLDARDHRDPELRAALADALQHARAQLQPPAPAPVPAPVPRTLPRRAVGAVKAVGRAVLPAPVRQAARRVLTAARGDTPAPGTLDLGHLRRVTPLCDAFGYTRGGPVDRVYIEAFLERHRADVRGRALEVGDATYLFRFGGDALLSADVLHVDPANPFATMIANLEHWPEAPEGRFDVIVFTQTLHLIYDVRGALATLHRLLAPGGVLLMTVPGISQIDRDTWGSTWYWAMTSHLVTRLCDDVFGPGRTEVTSHGNVLAAAGFLYGLGAGELRPDELAAHDPAYQVIVSARAVKGAS